MKITIKNYKTKLSEDVLRKSKHCKVRECDEVSEGVFESYVDEFDNSYDVRLTLHKNNLIDYCCECNSHSSICQHLAVLLRMVATGARPATGLVTGRKIDPQKRKVKAAGDWFSQTLHGIQDTSFAFTNGFYSIERELIPDELAQVTRNAVTAVINQRELMKDFAENIRVLFLPISKRDLWRDVNQSLKA